MKLLVLRCNNLVNSHRILQSKFVQQPDLIHQQQVATNAADKDFVEKATKIVEANLDKNEFDVNIFAMEMNLSRSSLFNKLKGVTGLTPNNFISNIRLKKAAEILINALKICLVMLRQIIEKAIKCRMNSTLRKR